MSKLIKIKITNFKGIKEVKLDIENTKSPGRFVTLVGLNEGGKTSIIEAASLSVLQDPDTADLLEATKTATDLGDAVPKHYSAGFTGSFDIQVVLDFNEDSDLFEKLDRIINADGYKLTSKIDRVIYVTKHYKFENSNHISNFTNWTFAPQVKKIRGKNELDLFESVKPTWTKCLTEIKTALPRSVYFPTFLVDFPKRVYLEGDYGKIDSYYRKVVSDALNGLENPLSIDKHIIQRVNKHRGTGKSFSSALRASAEGKQIDATIQALAAELNFVIFGAWGEVFEKPVKNRKIIAEWHIDENKENHIFLEFYIIAGDYRFSISERSLGFRWFFSFLLFTQFQGHRADKRKIIFLFDEPASHLHPKAQERLLKSFEKIANPNHVIIYSTHSHYLINPLWLEQAYIVSNSAIDAENDDTGIKQVDAKVSITAKKYKNFISNNPSKTTYYQPILDVLDHSSAGLDLSSPAIILEGKYDYYPFLYMLKRLGKDQEFKVIPCVGAGGLSALVGILRAWGVKFIIVLDDDDAGRKEKGKYRNQLLLSDNQVVTLDELDSSLKDKEFEGMFREDVIQECKKAGFMNDKKIGKMQLYSYFQSLIAEMSPSAPMKETLDLFGKAVNEIGKRLKAQ